MIISQVKLYSWQICQNQVRLGYLRLISTLSSSILTNLPKVLASWKILFEDIVNHFCKKFSCENLNLPRTFETLTGPKLAVSGSQNYARNCWATATTIFIGYVLNSITIITIKEILRMKNAYLHEWNITPGFPEAFTVWENESRIRKKYSSKETMFFWK